MSDHFLERTANKSLYVISEKKTFFYKESMVYPFVQASSSKKDYVITNNEFCVRFQLMWKIAFADI